MLRVSLHRFAEADGMNAVSAPSSSRADDTTKEEPPSVQPLPPLAERPFWSVMIPIYNAREDYLRETLQSVLCQDPGGEEMQIEVLDNCSTVGDPEALVREIGGGRVAFFRQTHNLGTPGNFNACIERARGRWVHILHGDDTVRPEFYRRARSGIEAHPEAAAALCRIIYMDEDGQWSGLTELESRQRGLLDSGFAWRQLLDQRVQFVGMVVARSTYEELGGFRPSLPHCLDWDMWKRIAFARPVHYDPEPLGCFRVHEGANSSPLIASGANVTEERRSIAYSCASLPASHAMVAQRAALKAAGVRAARRARLLWKKGLRGPAWRQIGAAMRCSLAPAVLARSAFFVLCAIVDRSHMVP
jgi:GT2 family glycosyltransferase